MVNNCASFGILESIDREPVRKIQMARKEAPPRLCAEKGIKEKPMLKKLFVLGMLLVVLVAGASGAPRGALAASKNRGDVTLASIPTPAVTCHSSMWLTPKEDPGWPWDQHRRWLEGAAYYGNNTYTIIDMNTYTSYYWVFWGNFSGRSRFGVSTSWAIFHPWWKSHAWLLLYNCY